jgi:hypothetical protein
MTLLRLVKKARCLGRSRELDFVAAISTNYFFQRADSSYIALTSARRRMFSAPESPRTPSSDRAA